MFRKKIHLEKDRDEDYLHHAVDALIVASIKKMNLLNGYMLKQEHDLMIYIMKKRRKSLQFLMMMSFMIKDTFNTLLI